MPETLPMIDMSAPVCCAPVAAGGPMSDDDALHVALRLKALADPALREDHVVSVQLLIWGGQQRRAGWRLWD